MSNNQREMRDEKEVHTHSPSRVYLRVKTLFLSLKINAQTLFLGITYTKDTSLHFSGTPGWQFTDFSMINPVTFLERSFSGTATLDLDITQ